MFYPEKSFSTIFAASVISSKHFMTKYFSLFLLIVPALTIAQNSNEINWIDIEKADQLRLKEPKKVIIDVYTDWCGWCKRMDKATFQKPEVAAYMNEHYYNVKFNAEQKEDITILNNTFTFSVFKISTSIWARVKSQSLWGCPVPGNQPSYDISID